MTALVQIALTQAGAAHIAAAYAIWARDEWMPTRKEFGVAAVLGLASLLI